MGSEGKDEEAEKMLDSIRRRYGMESLTMDGVDRDNIRTLAEHMRAHRGKRGRFL